MPGPSHCRAGGNLKTKGQKPVPGPSHCRTCGNLKTKGQKSVPGPIFIAGQVETL